MCANVQLCKRVQVSRHVHVHVRVQVRIRVHVRMHACEHVHMCAYMCTHASVLVRRRVQTCASDASVHVAAKREQVHTRARHMRARYTCARYTCTREGQVQLKQACSVPARAGRRARYARACRRVRGKLMQSKRDKTDERRGPCARGERR